MTSRLHDPRWMRGLLLMRHRPWPRLYRVARITRDLIRRRRIGLSK